MGLLSQDIVSLLLLGLNVGFIHMIVTYCYSIQIFIYVDLPNFMKASYIRNELGRVKEFGL